MHGASSLKSLIEERALNGSLLAQHESRISFTRGLGVVGPGSYEKVLNEHPSLIVSNLRNAVDKLPYNDEGGLMTFIIRASSPSVETFTRLK